MNVIIGSDSNFLTPGDPFDPHLKSLEEKGYTVIDYFLDPETISGLRYEMDVLREQGDFRRAGVGSGQDYQLNGEIRSDSIFWLDRSNQTPVQKKYFDQIIPLRDRVSEYFRIPLGNEEFFYAMYPPGGFYKKHYDNFWSESRRLLTCVLYLNSDRDTTMGGELRIYPPAEEDRFHTPFFPLDEPYQEVLPVAGRLVMFLTLYIPHSVERADKERRSIVSWFGSVPEL